MDRTQRKVIWWDVKRSLPDFIKGLVILGVLLLALVGAVDLLTGR